MSKVIENATGGLGVELNATTGQSFEGGLVGIAGAHMMHDLSRESSGGARPDPESGQGRIQALTTFASTTRLAPSAPTLTASVRFEVRNGGFEAGASQQTNRNGAGTSTTQRCFGRSASSTGGVGLKDQVGEDVVEDSGSEPVGQQASRLMDFKLDSEGVVRILSSSPSRQTFMDDASKDGQTVADVR